MKDMSADQTKKNKDMPKVMVSPRDTIGIFQAGISTLPKKPSPGHRQCIRQFVSTNWRITKGHIVDQGRKSDLAPSRPKTAISGPHVPQACHMRAKKMYKKPLLGHHRAIAGPSLCAKCVLFSQKNTITGPRAFCVPFACHTHAKKACKSHRRAIAGSSPSRADCVLFPCVRHATRAARLTELVFAIQSPCRSPRFCAGHRLFRQSHRRPMMRSASSEVMVQIDLKPIHVFFF